MISGSYEIIKILHSKGFPSYIVGGWVRDTILKVPSGDIDIATKATPEEVFDIFNKLGYKVLPTGIAHGTVTVLYDTFPYEITTFRKDVSCDGRNATVEYADSIEEDLSRRDFTINALAFDVLNGSYIDPYNGIADIGNKKIRSVGCPVDRFKEDYLRMLRAYRFKATLNFEIEDQTIEALWEASVHPWEKIVSIERIKAEFDKCFAKADKPGTMIACLSATVNLDKIMPELSETYGFEQNKHHKYDVFWHTIHALNAIPKEYPLIRWATLFHDLGKVPSRKFENGDYTFHTHELESVKIADKIMRRMKFSNDDSNYILNLVSHHMFKCSDDMKDSAIRRFVSSLGLEHVDALCILKYGDRVGNGKKSVSELNIADTKLKQRFQKILEEDAAFKIADLKVCGNDVMEVLNISPGPEVGQVLKALFEEVLEDPEKNNSDYLLNKIKQYKEE